MDFKELIRDKIFNVLKDFEILKDEIIVEIIL